MKKIQKLAGHTSTKYGEVFTEEQKVINQLIDVIRLLYKRVKDLENKPGCRCNGLN